MNHTNKSIRSVTNLAKCVITDQSRWPRGKHWQFLNEGRQLDKSILTVWQQTTKSVESHRGIAILKFVVVV